MPIYEFYCPDNNKLYTFFARSLSAGNKIPRCPDNPAFKLQKQLSSFAFVGRAKDPATIKPDADAEGMDDPRMEQLMAEMESDMEGMNDENPDPKQLARMLKKMTGIMGDKVPPEMNEMIRRMEKGEDPEKLEEEYGDVIEKTMGEEGMPGMDQSTKEAGSKSTMNRFLSNLRRPQRDPVLYEMSEYVE
ncbi:MAG: cytochrome C [Verrucomicrobiota bacterium]|nr:cytochrome C [Verrucomicrobiota bacterium]